jgi:hypothetical protein
MKLVPLLALLACSSAAPVAAQETAHWGQVGGWEIRVDRTVGNGCFAYQVYERGTIVRIGLDMNRNQVYFFFGNVEWKSIEEGKVYRVHFVFDQSSPYDGEMQGQRLGNSVFLSHRNVSEQFVTDFMQRNSLQLYYQGALIANVSLRNTYAAVGEVANCQMELNNVGGRTAPSGRQDPFASTRAKGQSNDPFK